MVHTNKYNLPDSIVRALTNDSYDLVKPENILSVTDIIAPPRSKILYERHKDKVEVDVSERFWMLLGTAGHYVLEKSISNDDLSEERWYIDIKTGQTYTAPEDKQANECEWYSKDIFYLSGKFDVYFPEEKKVSDYKFCSVWSWIYEKNMKEEHETQLNLNAFALRRIGFETKDISIVAMYRDWSKTKSKRDYTDIPVPIKEIYGRVWSDTECLDYMRNRINSYIEYRKLPDNKLPLCTEKERWSKGIKYAVMKEGRKTAVKLFDVPITPEILATYGNKHYVEERQGSDTRCEDYCDVCNQCDYYLSKYGG